MRILGESWIWMPCMVAVSAISIQAVHAQPPSAAGGAPSKVGGVAVADVLQRLGAKLEQRTAAKELDDYSNHFDRTDLNRDGRHTREEYVDKGGYMTPKVIVQGMDDDEDGLVERAEFVKHSTRLLDDPLLAEQVFAALDENADGGIPIPEYLRVWGQWARVGQKPAEERIATRRAELPDSANKPVDKAALPAQGRPGSGPPFGRPGAGSGPPDGFSPFGGQGGMRPGQAGLGRLAFSGLEIGKPFPTVKIVDADGKEFSTEQLKGHYTVLVAGCLTCPAFLGSYPGVEEAHRDYSSKGVKFYYVYRALAHPENNGIIKPFSLEERLMHVAEARTRLETRVPWLADNMNNDFKRTIGNTNNSEFLLDPEGRVVHMRMWSDGERLRAALAEHVGPVKKPTTIAELELPPFQMRSNTRGAVLPRIEVPGIMTPLRIEPEQNGQPFYVKLRAEAEQSVLANGSGKIYLGFHIDPIHNTHWNNLADPLHFEIKAPSGTQVTASFGDGPKLEVESDSDPREFLVSLDGADPDAPLSLTVRYFACSDDPAWCKAVEQKYTIHLVRDEFGGAVFGRTFRPASFGGGSAGDSGGGRPGFGPAEFRGPPTSGGFGSGGPPAGGPGVGPPGAEALFSRFDRNADGKLTEDEVPGPLWRRLSTTDADRDGAVTPEEFGKSRNGRPPADPPTGERSGGQTPSNSAAGGFRRVPSNRSRPLR